MIDLIYPAEELAPAIPPITYELAMHNPFEGQEVFPVIEEDGRVIGRASREYCHNGSHLLHPVVHLHLVDRRTGRIYLQKRSMKKDLLPGKWDTAVGGHIKYGETVSEALIREASEEIGLHNYTPIFLRSYTFVTDRDNEFVFVFASVGTFSPVPDHDEVDEGKWWTVREIERATKTDILTENFVKEFKMIKNQLLALI